MVSVIHRVVDNIGVLHFRALDELIGVGRVIDVYRGLDTKIPPIEVYVKETSVSVFSSVSVPVFEFSAPFGLFVRVAQEVTGISIARIKDSAIIRLEKQESIVYTPSDNYLQPYHFMAINVIAIITLI